MDVYTRNKDYRHGSLICFAINNEYNLIVAKTTENLLDPEVYLCYTIKNILEEKEKYKI